MGNSNVPVVQAKRQVITVEQYNDGWIKTVGGEVFYFSDVCWNLPEGDSLRKVRMENLHKCIIDIGDVSPGDQLKLVYFIDNRCILHVERLSKHVV